MNPDDMYEAYVDAASKFFYIYRWRWHFKKSLADAMVIYMNEMYERYGDPE